MKVLIAGGGIGGLTTALCLQQAGVEVKVFEQAAQLTDIGAGLQCGANAVKVLASLGLSERLAQVAVAPNEAQFVEYDTAKILYRVQFGADYAAKFGAPCYQVHRADLQEILVEALQQRAPDCLQLNSQISSYHEDDQTVSVQLADGSQHSGDCLIACDGIKSIVRQQMLQATSHNKEKTQPKWTGNIAWRGVLDVSKLPQDFMDKIVMNFVGPNKHMVVYYVRAQQLINFVGVVERPMLDENGLPQAPSQQWISKGRWQDMQADFAGWHSTVQTLIEQCDKQQCYQWALYNHTPLLNWSTNRVTLLGDAAHATLPFMASGAAMAIEDARVLQRALAQAPTVQQALQMYQKNRFQRTKKIQLDSVKMGKLYHLPNRFMRRTAFTLLNGVPEKMQNFLPDYDANTVTLK